VGNYYNEVQPATVYYKHPGTGEQVKLPLGKGAMEMPGLYAFLSPVGLKLSDGLQLLHTTSDLLGVEKTDWGWTLQLNGHRDLLGELALEGSGIEKITGFFLDDMPITYKMFEGKMVVNYSHLHNKEFALKIVSNK